MYEILNLSDEELQLVINNTADKLNLEFITYKNNIVFKGGTSLSKVYNLIERFSEDIDLALYWKVMGYDENEPYKNRSNTGQVKFNNKLNEGTKIFLKETVLPILNKDFKKLMKKNSIFILIVLINKQFVSIIPNIILKIQ